MTRATRRPLKVGIQLPEVERAVRWAELLDMTRAIEDYGFDSVWVGEHLLYHFSDRGPRGPWEAWSVLAAIAAATGRIELGPLVACTNFHNPVDAQLEMHRRRNATIFEGQRCGAHQKTGVPQPVTGARTMSNDSAAKSCPASLWRKCTMRPAAQPPRPVATTNR